MVIVWLKLLNISSSYIVQWDQLWLSWHYCGVLHIIGDKLAINGRFLSATDKMINQIFTFDDVSHTWTSYYLDLLSVRSMPGVVSHQEYIIIAGGKSIARWWHKTCIMILKFLSWRKIPNGEKCPLSYLYQLPLPPSYPIITFYYSGLW